MVYKHAISTVVPARNIKLPGGDEGGGIEHIGVEPGNV
jgi:hypothetical protein